VWCGSGGELIFNPVEEMLILPTDRTLKGQTIAERSASCYSFREPHYSLMAFCVDATEGIPLLITTESGTDSRLTQSMVAISVSTEEQGLAVPFGLEADPVKGFPDYEGVVPISDLGLPHLPELEQ
jgi:hypothetical protein